MKKYIKCFEQIKETVYESRKGVGKIIKITDHFGNSEYILYDMDRNIIDRDTNVNKLHRKLWDMKSQSIDVESSTSIKCSSRDSYKVDWLKKALQSMQEDEYFIPRLRVNDNGRHIDLDEGAIQVLIDYYN